MSRTKKTAEKKRAEKGTGSYRKKGNGYEYRFVIGDHKYSVYAATIEGCRAKEQDIREDVSRGVYKENHAVTMDAYFEEYLRAKSGNVVEATLIHNRSTYKRIGETFGKKKIREIEARQVKAFREKLEKEILDDRSPLTTHGGNDILELLSSILAAAMGDSITTHNPAENVKRFKRFEEDAKHTIHRKLSPDELAKFFAAAAVSFYLYLFEFMLLTGLRVGEACALYWTDINFEDGTINVSRSVTKTAGSKVKIGATAKTAAGQRTVHMNDDIRRVLAEQKARTDAVFGSKVTGLVFPSTSGEVARPSSVDTCIKGICKAAGIDRIGAHAFRHTFASNMVDAGVAPEVLKNILGHKNIKITLDTYYHANSDRMREAMEKVVSYRAAV